MLGQSPAKNVLTPDCELWLAANVTWVGKNSLPSFHCLSNLLSLLRHGNAYLVYNSAGQDPSLPLVNLDFLLPLSLVHLHSHAPILWCIPCLLRCSNLQQRFSFICNLVLAKK